MPQYYSKNLAALGLIGALTFVTPLTGNAQTADTVEWNRGQAELQKELVPGKAPETYRQKLEQLGYKVTSTNYNNPDYLEYEVVKGNQSWEVQIDIDDDAHKATEIEVKRNVWQAEPTRDALREAQQRMARTDTTGNGGVAGATAGSTAATRRAVPMRNNQYSDRDRADTDQLVRELEALPLGRDKNFYKDALRQRGYEISRINTDDKDELQLEAVKDGNSVQMEVSFDENTGRSTDIDASSLWSESESTKQTRESQEQRSGMSPTAQQQSSMNRNNDDRQSQENTTDSLTRSRSGDNDTPVTPGTPSDRTANGFDSGMERHSQNEVDQ